MSAENQGSFRLSTEPNGTTVTLTVSGCAEGQEARRLRDFLIDLLEKASGQVVDLRGLEAADTAGLGALAAAKLWAEKKGRSVIFKAPSPAVKDAIKAARLEKFFNLQETD